MSSVAQHLNQFARATLAVAMLALAPTAVAENVNLNSIESASTYSIGSFDALICYAPVSATCGKLTVKLTNLSQIEKPIYITGFAFNLVSADPCAKANLSSAPNCVWKKFQGSASPFGSFKSGATLGNICCGQIPNKAIHPGATATFTFWVFASDAALLTAQSFAVGPNTYDFVVRFKGKCDGQTDLVPGADGCIYSGPADVQVVLDSFGAEGSNIADLNGDAVVDGADLSIVLEAWRDCAIGG